MKGHYSGPANGARKNGSSVGLIEKLRQCLALFGLVEPAHRRRGVRRPVKDDLLGPGVRVVWGGSWYPYEYFSGETFRWARNDAQMLVLLPEGPPRRLVIQVEPGPAVGFGPCELQVRDQSGQTLATAVVRRRTWVELPAFSIPPGRSQVISLHVENGRAPKVTGDSRRLVLKLLWCGWAKRRPKGKPNQEPGPKTNNRQFDVVRPSDGFLCGWGWSRPERDRDAVYSRGAVDGAEIIFRPLENSRVPMLDLEALPGVDALEIRTPEGEAVTFFSIASRCQRVLPLKLTTGNFYVYTIHAKGSSANPIVRLFGCVWQRASEGVEEGVEQHRGDSLMLE